MSEPISRENASFRPEYFKYYDESSAELTNDPDVESFVIVDPAKTAKATSAFSAVVGVGVNLRSNAIYVRDLVMARMERDELMDAACQMTQRLRAHVLGVEVTGLDQWIEQPFKDEISRRALSVHFVPLHAKKGKGELAHEGGKVGRVAGLIPYYRQGLVYHNENVTGPLEAQLRSFPRAKRWDAMDALAYILELLDYGERYFWPQRASEPGYDLEAEYAELEADDYLPEIEIPDCTQSDYAADWATI
jgi:phage terminase large subunit-like protein